MEKVLEYVDNSFESAEEQAAFDVYDANNINPLYGFFVARAGLGASESMRSKLAEYNDPRLSRAFITKLNKVHLEKNKPRELLTMPYMRLTVLRNKALPSMGLLYLCIQQQPLLF